MASTERRRPRTLGALVVAAVAVGATAPAACAATAPASPAATAAAARGTTTITLAGPAAKALRAGGVELAATRPARANAKRIALPVKRTARSSGRPLLVHGGAVRLRAGRRTVRLTALRTAVGARSSTVSAKVGARRVSLFTVATGARAVDAAAGAVRARGAAVRLTKPGAKALKRGLRLSRLPAGRIGRAAVQAKLPATRAPAPAPTPAPLPAPAPPAPKPPAPTPQLCPSAAPAPTPVDGIGQTVWSGKRTWIDYVLRHWPGPGPASTGCVLATGGASQVDPADRYRWQFTATSVAGADGSAVTLQHKGALEFRAPGHFISTTIADPTFTLSGDRLSGTVVADGASSGEMADAMRDGYQAPRPFSRVQLLDLDLAHAIVEVGDDVVRYRDVPATVSADGAAILSYPAGTDWGSFSFELPADLSSVVPAVRWRLRKSFVDYMLREWSSMDVEKPYERFGRVAASGGAVAGVSVGSADAPETTVTSYVWSGNRADDRPSRASAAFVSSPDHDYQADKTDGTAPAYQAQFATRAATVNANGETVVQLGGRIALQMPAHFIDVEFDAPRIVIAADRASAKLLSDGHDNGSIDCATNPACENRKNAWDGMHVLDLDLSTVTPTSATAADGTPLTVWSEVETSITEGAARPLNYGAGESYGRFTFAVPTALLP
ncbi:HtaA domain-containing protein [Conexibacter arvalis]|uniref:Htaa domain-containing protein n=1 Tax=Conexibacter arvalis TaxID=912552 RepID=A0A840IIY2_9ACTN|nr:HtaA domain-containing protein [Conexibacter arvalis]MBB4664143.1 hypothetical protein [Conexibacter arvalis]